MAIALANTREDIQRCFPVMAELRPQLVEAGFVARVQRQQKSGYHLAFLTDKKIVKAMAGYRFSESLSWGKFMYVDDLVTAEKFRSQGHGQRLFQWLVKEAKARGCDQFHLDSGVQRFGAHRFYLASRMDIIAHHFSLKLEMKDRLVWITGAGGLIGNYLVQTAPKWAPVLRVKALTRAELNLEDFAAVREAFRKDSPGLVIHCAALANTPACEKNPPLAQKLNVDVTRVLAELATDIPFVFFSTDLVFDGRAGNYDESAAVSPLSAYGKTKADAERVVLANPNHTVLRTSLNFGQSPTGDRAFNEQMRRAVARGETLQLFTDEFRCPIPAVETARAVWELVMQNKPGLYHVVGGERLSRWEIGELLAKHWGLNPKMEPGSIRDFRGLPRSPDTSLNCAKVQRLLSFPLPRFSEWLAKADGK